MVWNRNFKDETLLQLLFAIKFYEFIALYGI